MPTEPSHRKTNGNDLKGDYCQIASLSVRSVSSCSEFLPFPESTLRNLRHHERLAIFPLRKRVRLVRVIVDEPFLLRIESDPGPKHGGRRVQVNFVFAQVLAATLECVREFLVRLDRFPDDLRPRLFAESIRDIRHVAAGGRVVSLQCLSR